MPASMTNTENFAFSVSLEAMTFPAAPAKSGRINAGRRINGKCPQTYLQRQRNHIHWRGDAQDRSKVPRRRNLRPLVRLEESAA